MVFYKSLVNPILFWDRMNDAVQDNLSHSRFITTSNQRGSFFIVTVTFSHMSGAKYKELLNSRLQLTEVKGGKNEGQR